MFSHVLVIQVVVHKMSHFPNCVKGGRMCCFLVDMAKIEQTVCPGSNYLTLKIWNEGKTNEV